METWLEFDAALEVAAFGDEEQLAKFVQNPVQFKQHRADCIIGWSDQIPCWLKMTRGKQVYAASERSKTTRLKTADFQKMQDEKLKSLDEAAELLQKAEDIEDAEEETEAIQAGGMEEEKEVQKETGTEEQELQKAVATTLQEETALGDTTLRRGVGSAEDEKWRCTVEHRLVLKDYFKQGADPEAYNWRPALIVKTASHCRLSNIIAEGTWREDEQFEAAGKVVMRSAGRSAGRVLAPWLKLREQGLLQNWEVYGQPAAVTDAVIQQWMLQSMGEQFPCSIWVRDAVGSSWAPEVQLSMRVIGQIAVKIRAGITDLVQPTDTDFAASLKASLRAAQSEEKKRMMESAAAAGERASFKCSVPSFGTHARCSLAVAGGKTGAETLDAAQLEAEWRLALEARLRAAEAGACSQAEVGCRTARRQLPLAEQVVGESQPVPGQQGAARCSDAEVEECEASCRPVRDRLLSS